ncbi:hypothetical protein ACFPRL_01840 [Pseudoclavibacter helvolus]
MGDLGQVEVREQGAGVCRAEHLVPERRGDLCAQLPDARGLGRRQQLTAVARDGRAHVADCEQPEYVSGVAAQALQDPVRARSEVEAAFGEDRPKPRELSPEGDLLCALPVDQEREFAGREPGRTRREQRQDLAVPPAQLERRVAAGRQPSPLDAERADPSRSCIAVRDRR